MGTRWLGLLRPHVQTKAKQIRAKARREPSAQTHALRMLGWTGAIVCALAVNVIAVRALAPPDAYASARFLNIKTPPNLVTPKDEDVRLLAATMWGEARSEGEHGMRAVAHVMVNRVGPRFGSDLRSVILAPWQFSAWNLNDPNRPLVQNPERYANGGENLETWIAAQRIAREVLSGASVDPTNGALFYHTTAIKPRWSHHGVGKEIIGAHIFYRDVPDQIAGVRRINSERALDAMNQPARAAISNPTTSAPQGRRGGRVHGIIQHAPPSAEPEAPPEIIVDVSKPVTPPELAAAIEL